MPRKIHHMLAGAAANFNHISGFSSQDALQHGPDRLMIAVKGRRVEAAVRFNRPAVFTELDDIVSHDILPELQAMPIRFNPPRHLPQSLTRRRITFMLRLPVFWRRNHALTDRFPTTRFFARSP